ncbi:unnamed protein product [Alopecurus aequalis]
MESQERPPEEIHGDNDADTVADLQNRRHGEGKKRMKKKERLLDFLRATPPKRGAFLSRVASLRTRAATMHAAVYGNFFRAPAFARAVDWHSVRSRGVAWVRHPMNAGLLVWLGFVAAGVAFVFLLMVGALDSAVPDATRSSSTTDDVTELRAVYCKNCPAGGVRRERLHVAVVVLLLHGTCFAQYAYCALFWLLRSDARPAWAVNLCMGLGLGAPVVAGLYMVYGPLGQKSALPSAASTDEEAQEDVASTAKANRTCSRRVVVSRPEWAGGLFDLADDPTVAALSLSCTFCVFGWNMERLGLGNIYVHAFTFALLCAAPLLVFAVAALTIRDATLGYLVGATGALLSVLGLTYGGFWRARMRKRFGLPADDRSCAPVCGETAADYAKWLLCAPCALAQEVRTGNFYDVEGEGLYVREEGDEGEEGKPAIAPLEREGCLAALMLAEKTGERTHAPPVPVRVTDRGFKKEPIGMSR